MRLSQRLHSGPVVSTKVVAVWKSTWLPPSETFVANQIAALQRWDALAVGLRTEPDGLQLDVSRAPFGHSIAGKVARRISAALGYRFVYDRLLRTSDARLIHAHFGRGAISVLPIARRLGLPLVVTFHGYDVNRAPRAPGRVGATYRRDLQEVFTYASSLIAVSDFIASRLVALGAPPEKVVVRYIGVPLSQAVPPAAERHGIVFVGRLVEVKGVHDLIQAVSRLPETSRRATSVTVVGYGPELAALQELASTLGVDVSFLGRRPPEEVASILSRAQIFCGPSRTAAAGDAEAFGTVYMEAALQSLPVVAYRHGGVPEAVEDGVTGLLAPEGDVDALAASLDSLIRDPDLARRMGRAGHDRVHRLFDVRACTAALEALYDEVTSSRHPTM